MATKTDAEPKPRRNGDDSLGRCVLASVAAIVVGFGLLLGMMLVASWLNIKDISLPYEVDIEEPNTINLWIVPGGFLAFILGACTWIAIADWGHSLDNSTPKEAIGVSVTIAYLVTLTILAAIVQSLIRSKLSVFQGSLLSLFSLSMAAVIGFLFFNIWKSAVASTPDANVKYLLRRQLHAHASREPQTVEVVTTSDRQTQAASVRVKNPGNDRHLMALYAAKIAIRVGDTIIKGGAANKAKAKALFDNMMTNLKNNRVDTADIEKKFNAIYRRAKDFRRAIRNPDGTIDIGKLRDALADKDALRKALFRGVQMEAASVRVKNPLPIPVNQPSKADDDNSGNDLDDDDDLDDEEDEEDLFEDDDDDDDDEDLFADDDDDLDDLDEEEEQDRK